MLRPLRRNWKLYSIAVFSLAVAMALSVAGLSLSNALLLRPPLARDPDRLVHIFTVAANGAKESVSYLDYEYLRDHNRGLAGIAAFNYGFYRYDLTFQGREELAEMDGVSDNYFQVLGIQPFLGRFFTAGDDRRRAGEAVLTYACWKRWGADPQIAGKTISINRQPLVILGVAPPQFIGPEFGIASDVVVNLAAPQRIGEASLEDRQARLLLLVGRLRPGVTRSQARAEVRTLWTQLAAAWPDVERDRSLDVLPAGVLPPEQLPTARLISAVLIAAVLLILLIACANTSNLLLAVATGRRQEALVKTALGASRRRLILEFLRETLALAAAGGALGYALATVTLQWISRFDVPLPMIGALPISADLHPGFAVTAATLLLIAGTTLVSGLAPAWYASRLDLATALSGESGGSGPRRGILRHAVVVVQVAVCTLVLVGAGLCTRSLYNLRHVDPGFSARNILMLVVGAEDIPPAQIPRLYDALRSAAARIPGVEAVSLSDDLPLGGDNGDHDEVQFTDRPAAAQKIFIDKQSVGEDYFSTLGIRLLTGRWFRASDRETSPEVVVINHFMAERYWPRKDAVGRTIRIVDPTRPQGSRTVTIAGVVADGKYTNLDDPPQSFLYLSLAQHPVPDFRLIARTGADPRRWSEPMASLVRQLGMKTPVPPITLASWINLTLFVPLVTFGATVGLGLLAILLAAVGLYGAISYSVGGRRKELGIRIALGARPAQLMRLVFRETLALVGSGVLAGAALGVAAGQLFHSRFYGVHAVEWTVLAPVALGMVAASLAIAFAAARRWTRMNPMDAVRHG